MHSVMVSYNFNNYNYTKKTAILISYNNVPPDKENVYKIIKCRHHTEKKIRTSEPNSGIRMQPGAKLAEGFFHFNGISLKCW